MQPPIARSTGFEPSMVSQEDPSSHRVDVNVKFAREFEARD